jgi:cation transporter-like permease
MEIFDSALKNRVRAASRKQTIIAVIVAILSLIAGWLLNAVSPLNFTNLFHP